jgi:hypothetical protein
LPAEKKNNAAAKKRRSPNGQAAIPVVTAAMGWGIWKLRNSFCFQDVAWINRKMLWWRVLAMLRSWRILVPLKQLDGFDAVFTGDAGGCSGANHMETDQHERCVA